MKKLLIILMIGIHQAAFAAATAPTKKVEAPETQGATDASFKKSAAEFVQSAQAYLGIANLSWQNFMDNPTAQPTEIVLKKDSENKALIADQFTQLMSTNGKSDALADKVKDFYAAWGFAYASMRPTSTDSRRGYSMRTNAEYQKIEALAARLKMDL